MTAWIRKHPLISFFIVTYAIMFTVLFGYYFMDPSRPLQQWSLAWFVSIFSPTITAVFLSWIIGGKAEVKRLLSGFTRWNVGWRWYLAAGFLLLGPLAVALIFSIFTPAEGLKPGITLPILLGEVLFKLFSGPLGEEAGWRGFALPRLQQKFSALVSSLILGVIWTFWHLPLLFLAGASRIGMPFPFYLLLVVTLAVYFTWLYNNTRGSLMITVLAHFSFNLTATLITGMVTLMPTMLFYMTASPLLGLVVIAVVIIFGARHLSKKPATELAAQTLNQPAAAS